MFVGVVDVGYMDSIIYQFIYFPLYWAHSSMSIEFPSTSMTFSNVAKITFCFFINFFPNECPDLCWYRPGHSLGNK